MQETHAPDCKFYRTRRMKQPQCNCDGERLKPVVGSHWKHFKGNVYAILAIGTHTETHEEMVLYSQSGAIGTVKNWIRPMSMFVEKLPDGSYRFEKYR